ncbi:uncharacterized protein LOC141853585 [Brevipalpus obovatus]|uniref:uncharacterized protein LOC141853585 n=1 Tax=Brevipalpus obovatus TaxID=246614 RepID=UPI003D9F3EB6
MSIVSFWPKKMGSFSNQIILLTIIMGALIPFVLSMGEKGHSMHKIFNMDLETLNDTRIRMTQETIDMNERAKFLLSDKMFEKVPEKMKKSVKNVLNELQESTDMYIALLKRRKFTGINGRKTLAHIYDTLDNFQETLDHISLLTSPDYSKWKYKLTKSWMHAKRKMSRGLEKAKAFGVGAGYRTIGFEDDDDDENEYKNAYNTEDAEDKRMNAPPKVDSNVFMWHGIPMMMPPPPSGGIPMDKMISAQDNHNQGEANVRMPPVQEPLKWESGRTDPRPEPNPKPKPKITTIKAEFAANKLNGENNARVSKDLIADTPISDESVPEPTTPNPPSEQLAFQSPYGTTQPDQMAHMMRFPMMGAMPQQQGMQMMMQGMPGMPMPMPMPMPMQPGQPEHGGMQMNFPYSYPMWGPNGMMMPGANMFPASTKKEGAAGGSKKKKILEQLPSIKYPE